MLKKLYHGAAYYPEVWDKETILKDIEIMKEVGLNVVRMGEFCWSVYEPKKDQFNIGIFDEVIDLLAKNGIEVIMCTPTPTPPHWLLIESPESAYVNYNMVASEHGSREHVCLNSPFYRERSAIICEKVAEHYGSNPNVIAWQTHNEYNCPPVRECLCDNCKKAWQDWLRTKYATIEELNDAWCNDVWSRSYYSFDTAYQPRPTPNGHNASLSNKYIEFYHDKVSEYNNMEVEILKKYTKAPITHNTNLVFYIDQEGVFENRVFVRFDEYMTEPEKVESLFDYDICRCLKPGVPFFEMETASSYTANIHGHKPYHKRGYVRAEAASNYFANGRGFSYWLFRQHRGGTEIHHAHLVTAWGAKSRSCVNVEDVTALIKDIEPTMLSSKPKQADVAIVFSDNARAYIECESFGFINYFEEVKRHYDRIMDTGIYRDVLTENASLDGYKVIFVPYLVHVSPSMLERIERAARSGATVVVGPFTGWRNEHHALYTDCAMGPLEKLIGCEVKDISHFLGQDATYEMLGKSMPITSMSLVVDSDEHTEGTVKGGYYDGMSMFYEKKLGEGKIILVGTIMNDEMLSAFMTKVIDERVGSYHKTVRDVAMYERLDNDGNTLLCYSNMSGETKTVSVNGYDVLRSVDVDGELVLEPYGYAIVRTV